MVLHMCSAQEIQKLAIEDKYYEEMVKYKNMSVHLIQQNEDHLFNKDVEHVLYDFDA